MRIFGFYISRTAPAESVAPREGEPTQADGSSFDSRCEYRIVADCFCGYEVQYRTPTRTGFSDWQQCATPGKRVNTHVSLDKAEKFARQHAKNGGIEKFLGRLP